MNAGDWVIFDLSIGQIKELRENKCATFSDGTCETSGMIAERFRPLSLRAKRCVETFDIYYMRLRQIDGEAGFNYSIIHQHFAKLALEAIDFPEKEKAVREQAQAFVIGAKSYTPVIQGIHLFRPNL